MAVAALLFTSPAAAAEISGRATVVDGEAIGGYGTRARMNGIDAPKGEQSCHDDQGRRHLCGVRSVEHLA